MTWKPPEKKVKVPEFNQYIAAHVSEDVYDKIYKIAQERNLSVSVIIRSMIDHCLEEG